MDFEILIPEHLAGRQWKSILRGEFGASERLLRQFARDNAVFVNGQPVYLTARANHGDILTVRLPRETSSVAPEPIPITIAYEDSEILVVNKPPGMLTHPSAKEKYGSLLAGANAHLAQSGLVAHCVHRLDKDTSGLVMMAKHAHFHHLFDHALRRGLIHRTYVAIVDVKSAPDEQALREGEWHTINLPIGQDRSAPSKRIIDDEEGRAAITHYQVLERAGNYALMGIMLETGRTHQIRLHFSAIGMALSGEPHYGNQAPDGPQSGADLLMRRPRGPRLRRQALHAAALRWEHPLTKERFAIFAKAPADLASFWDEVGGHKENFALAHDLQRG